MKIKSFFPATLFAIIILAGCQNNKIKEQSTEAPSTNNALVSFAQCLTDNGAVMYGTQWCSYCNAQRESFGESFAQVNYIDCEKNQKKCQDEGIQGYPTWKFKDGSSQSGLQPLEKLAEKTDCSIPLNITGPRK